MTLMKIVRAFYVGGVSASLLIMAIGATPPQPLTIIEAMGLVICLWISLIVLELK